MLDKQERSEARQLVPGDNKLTIVRQNKKVEHVTISGNTPLYSSIHIPEQKLKETLLKCCGKPTNKQTSIAGDLLMYQKGVSAFNSHSSDESELLLSQSIQNRILTQYETQ